MSTQLHVAVLGLTAAVELTGLSDDEAAAFEESWSGSLAPEGAPVDLCVRAQVGGAGDDGSYDLRASTYAELADRLTARITVAAIEHLRSELLMLHSGAVADPATGAVVGYIGPSGRGKTTASIALSRAFGYVTDETLAIRDDLSVIPYRKPLSVKQPAPEVWKVQSSPRELGLGELPDAPLHLVALILLNRTDEHPEDAPPILTRISIADSISELVPQISYLPYRPAPLQRLRHVIEQVGGLQQVTYRESATLVDIVRELLKSPRAVMPFTVDEGAQPPAAVDPVPGAVTRSVVTDAIRDGGGLIILHEGTVRVLDGIAPTIWDAAATPSTIDELVDAVVEVYGPPPEGQAVTLVSAAVDELLLAGVLERAP